MIVVRIKGGLGNQLFQYAAAYALAKRLKQPLKLDMSFYPEQSLRSFKLSLLKVECEDIAQECDVPTLIRLINNRYLNRIIRGLNLRVIPVSKNYKYCVETRSRVNEWFFEIVEKNIFIEGYFQSEKYFKEYRDDFLSQFTQKYIPDVQYKAALYHIQNSNSVAVHVRRGDFLKAQYNNNPHHYLLGEKYYKNAIEYIESHISNPKYYWFSDDIDWVKRNFGEQRNFHFISLKSNHGDIDELLLMSKCKHIIAANSTFSWWASWLNIDENALHLCPAKRYGNESMIPENWIKISVE